MGRLTGDNINQFKNYPADGSKKKRNYLTLKEHGETAHGRILCNSAADIECYVVHRVSVGDKGYEREVNCLFEAGGTPDDCPFCRAKLGRAAKIYIPFYDSDSGDIKVFERPNSYYNKISGYCSRYSPIVSYDIDIVRNGAPNFSKTDYDIFPGPSDNATIEDILDDCGVDEVPKILGLYVLNKTADDMEYYLKYKDFPDDYDSSAPSAESAPVRRRGYSDRQDTSDSGTRRRF